MTGEKIIKNSFSMSHLFTEWMFKRLLKITSGSLVLQIGKETFSRESTIPGLVADMNIHQPLAMARRCAMRGDLGFAESYMAGEWSSTNLDALLQQLLRNDQSIKYSSMRSSTRRIGSQLLHRLRSNSLSGSRKNIAYHYDLGNDFYKLWLDSSMTYSSAVYESPELSLADAQQAKNNRILKQLKAQPGATLLEIGCGWGGFLEAAAQQKINATGITLSEEQHAYATERIGNYSDICQAKIKDYRLVEEQYDHIVSIEMFEAVGEAWWPTYFETLDRCLKPGGTAVLQVITINEELFEKYKKFPDFIQRYIFPGGMLPTKDRMQTLCNDQDLEITDQFSFGKDYAKTLELWHQNFDQHKHTVEGQGYDQRFIQMWKYYLSYCRAGFMEETIDVVQYTLKKPG